MYKVVCVRVFECIRVCVSGCLSVFECESVIGGVCVCVLERGWAIVLDFQCLFVSVSRLDFDGYRLDVVQFYFL